MHVLKRITGVAVDRVVEFHPSWLVEDLLSAKNTFGRCEANRSTSNTESAQDSAANAAVRRADTGDHSNQREVARATCDLVYPGRDCGCLSREPNVGDYLAGLEIGPERAAEEF
jgi:hypothetical protein